MHRAKLAALLDACLNGKDGSSRYKRAIIETLFTGDIDNDELVIDAFSNMAEVCGSTYYGEMLAGDDIDYSAIKAWMKKFMDDSKTEKTKLTKELETKRTAFGRSQVIQKQTATHKDEGELE